MNQTTTTVEELGASSRQSAAQAESMATCARQSFDVTQQGIRLTNEVSASVTEMKQKVASVVDEILRLSEQVGQIGSIARVVGEIAGETNMLALNAAVEAALPAQAGRLGRAGIDGTQCAAGPGHQRHRCQCPRRDRAPGSPG